MKSELYLLLKLVQEKVQREILFLEKKYLNPICQGNLSQKNVCRYLPSGWTTRFSLLIHLAYLTLQKPTKTSKRKF